MNRRVAAFTLAATALLGLTACTVSPGADSSQSPPTSGSPTPSDDQTGTPSADGQTVAEACALIEDTMTEAADEFADVSTKDPEAVAEAMNRAAEKLTDAAGDITNQEVAAILPDLEEMFAKTSEVMQGILDGDASKIEELAALGDEFREASERFQELCGSE